MKIEDEGECIRRAVNEAAREDKPDDEPIADYVPPPVASLAPSGPDLKIYISANPTKGRYSYRLVDASTGLSHCCVRILPGADSTGLALLAVRNALRSIEKNRITELLMERYGYLSRSAALASRKRLKIELVVLDPALAQFGALITATENENAFEFLPLTESDRRVWTVVLDQTRRFETTWNTIAPTAAILSEMEACADLVLFRAAHGGPVYSFQRDFSLPIEDAA